jgi:hypothetical protein
MQGCGQDGKTEEARGLERLRPPEAEAFWLFQENFSSFP